MSHVAVAAAPETAPAAIWVEKSLMMNIRLDADQPGAAFDSI
ncbi:hypothetical protein [Shewanella carassii]|nr:hypothetical protein [Shewanella carassii]